MSEPDKELVRERAFDVIRDYRDRGCPAALRPGRRTDAGHVRRDVGRARSPRSTSTTSPRTCASATPIKADRYWRPHRSSAATSPWSSSDAVRPGCWPGSSSRRRACRSRSSKSSRGWAERGWPTAIRVAASTSPTSTTRTHSSRLDHWTHYYSEQPEILQYLNDVATRYDIAPDVRFNTEVTGAAWDEESATWRVAIRGADGRAETLTARALICAVGQFSNSVIPDIKGAKDFRGPSFHTADWRDDVDLTGKRVAVIGAGASGFQLVPAIADSTRAGRRLPAHAAVDGAQSRSTTTPSPTGPGGRSAICRTTGGGCASCRGGRSPTRSTSR